MDTSQALHLAHDHNLDLVEVSPITQPPVCRIMDYGSYQYQQEKKERKQKAKAKKVEIKGIRLSLKIAANDLDIRKNQSLKFLEQGHALRLELILRGRERAHADRAREIIKNFITALTAHYPIDVERDISQQGGRLSLIVRKH